MFKTMPSTSLQSVPKVFHRPLRQLKCNTFILSKKKPMIKSAVLNTSINAASGLIADIVFEHNLKIDSYDYVSYFKTCYESYIVYFTINLFITFKMQLKNDNEMNTSISSKTEPIDPPDSD